MQTTSSVRVQKSVSWLFATRYGLLGGLLFLCGGISLMSTLLAHQPESTTLAVVFLVLAIVLLSVHTAIMHKDRALIQTGRKVTGHADNVLGGVLTHSGPVVYMRHFSVRFHYTVDGVDYNGCSRFYWAAPTLPSDGSLTIFVDAANPQRCAVDLWAV